MNSSQSDLPHQEEDEDDYEYLVKKNHLERQEQLNPLIDCILSPLAQLWYFYNHHRTEFLLACLLLCSVGLAITGIVEEIDHKLNPHISHHIDANFDDLNVHSRYNLKIGNVDHWCIDGSDDTCPYCLDPTEPANHMDSKGWSRSFTKNVHLAKKNAYALPNNGELDVVFLGDGLTEAKNGMKKGRIHPGLQQVRKDFDDIFGIANPEAENPLQRYKGVALGITGDTTKNLLWRIQEEEFQTLQPRIWWISIGIEDLLSTSCSEEITLMGILRVVEELVAREDGSIIVLNSLFPTTLSIKHHKDSGGKPKPTQHFSTKYSGRHSHNEIAESIDEINSKLASFASKHKGIKFFDATPHFIKSNQGTDYLKKELYSDSFHLSTEGHMVWMTQQAHVISNIYQQQNEEHEEPKDQGVKVSQDQDGEEVESDNPDYRSYYDLDYYRYDDDGMQWHDDFF